MLHERELFEGLEPKLFINLLYEHELLEGLEPELFFNLLYERELFKGLDYQNFVYWTSILHQNMLPRYVQYAIRDIKLALQN